MRPAPRRQLRPGLLDVYHVRLRDTSKDQLQVRIGQGLIEYGKLISQLARVPVRPPLSVDIVPVEGVDQYAEMRKMRLLLESLLSPDYL